MTINIPEIRFAIDERELDVECLGQAEQVNTVNRLLADAKYEADQASSALKLAKARANLQCRENPTEVGLSKVTEGVIDAAVVTMPEVIAAEKKLNAAVHVVGVLQAASVALQDRKRMLTLLVDLFLQNYFSNVPVKGPASPMPRGIRPSTREDD